MPKLFTSLEQMLDAITMYRVVLYGLCAVIGYAAILSVLGVLSIQITALAASALTVVATVVTVHYVCVFLTRAPANIESSLITALILVLILTPTYELSELLITMAIAAGAVVLKYVVVYKHRHIFNPAALVLVCAGLLGASTIEWWVSSRYLLPITLIVGALVAIKTRRLALVLVYVLASTAAVVLYFWGDSPIMDIVIMHFVSWPTIFFATIMLTEPLSLPSTKRLQYMYALIAAGLGSVPFSIGPLYGTPELALVAANLFTFVVDTPVRYVLTFLKREPVGKDTYEYHFTSSYSVKHLPGQYMEWTLPHPKPDVRGIRRYFTISSAPQSPTVSFAVKHLEKQSSWKRTLQSMQPGAVLFATQRAGDFVLERHTGPYVWIAGGIGITPFMSMVRHAQKNGQRIDATLFYCNKSESDIAFRSEIEAMEQIGVQVVHVLVEQPTTALHHTVGFITEAVLDTHAPEWKRATFFISGPPGLVAAYETLLAKARIPSHRVVTDYFPGLA